MTRSPSSKGSDGSPLDDAIRRRKPPRTLATMMSQRRADLDDVETIGAYAQDMSEFLKEERTDRAQGLHRNLRQGDRRHARRRPDGYTIPMPDDSHIPGRNAEEMPLNGSVLSTVKIGGLGVSRTIGMAF